MFHEIPIIDHHDRPILFLTAFLLKCHLETQALSAITAATNIDLASGAPVSTGQKDRYVETHR